MFRTKQKSDNAESTPKPFRMTVHTKTRVKVGSFEKDGSSIDYGVAMATDSAEAEEKTRRFYDRQNRDGLSVRIEKLGSEEIKGGLFQVFQFVLA